MFDEFTYCLLKSTLKSTLPDGLWEAWGIMRFQHEHFIIGLHPIETCIALNLLSRGCFVIMLHRTTALEHTFSLFRRSLSHLLIRCFGVYFSVTVLHPQSRPNVIMQPMTVYVNAASTNALHPPLHPPRSTRTGNCPSSTSHT